MPSCTAACAIVSAGSRATASERIVVGDPHDLVEADPALVARAAAARAADGLVGLEVEADVEAVGAHDLGGDRRAPLALLAQQAREALGDDAVDRASRPGTARCPSRSGG